MTSTVYGVGDLVQLKSGGPIMTVQSVNASGNATLVCHWFNGKKLESGRFASGELEIVRNLGV